MEKRHTELFGTSIWSQCSPPKTCYIAEGQLFSSSSASHREEMLKVPAEQVISFAIGSFEL